MYLSDAPLHYYATTKKRLRIQYAAACKAIGVEIDVTRTESSELRLIGAPTAAISWTMTALAVDSLRDRVQYPWRHSRATLKANIAALNALSLYTAIMYMAVIASRGNRHLSSTTYRHFAKPDPTSVHGIVLSYDKGAGFALDCRVCAIPALLIEQVEALIIQTCRLIDKLRSKASKEHKALRERLETVVEGRAPLFYQIDGLHFRPLGGDGIQPQWPEFQPKAPRLRHLLNTYGPLYRMRACDLAQQSGHRVDYTPFDKVDPESPVDFMNRLAPKLDTYLRKLGFVAIGTSKDPAAKAPPPAPASRADWRGVSQAENQEITQGRRRARPSREDRAAAIASVRALRDKLADTAPKLHQATFDEFISDTWDTASSTVQKIATYNALRDMAKSNETLGELLAVSNLSAPVVQPKDLAPIRERHFLAFHSVRYLIGALKGELTGDQETSAADSASIISLLVLAALLQGIPSEPGRFAQILASRSRLFRLPSAELTAVLSLPTIASSDDYDLAENQFMSFVIPQQALPTLIKLWELNVDLGTAYSAVKSNALILETLPDKKPERFLEIVGLARALTTSGIRHAVECGELNSVGPMTSSLVDVTTNQLFDRAPTNPTTTTDANSFSTISIIGDAMIRQMHRALVRALGNYKNEKANLRHKRLPEVLEQITQIQASTPKGSFAHAVATFAARALSGEIGRGARLAPSTIHSYVSGCSKLVNEFHGRDFSGVSEREFAAELESRETLLAKLERRTTQSDQPYLYRELRKILLEADAEFPAQFLSSMLPDSAYRPAGYLTSLAQQQHVVRTLSQWWDEVGRRTSEPGQIDEFESALLACEISQRSGLRHSELTGLLIRDVRLVDNRLSISVTPNNNRELKTKSSRRPITLFLEPDVVRFVERGIENRKAASNDTTCFFRKSNGAPYGDQLAKIIAEASTGTIGYKANRMHAARHNLATATGAHLSTGAHDGLPIFIEPIPLSNKRRQPIRMLYRRMSRFLGHGSPVTTLSYYDHSIWLQTEPGTSLFQWRGSDIDWLISRPTSRSPIHGERLAQRQADHLKARIDEVNATFLKPFSGEHPPPPTEILARSLLQVSRLVALAQQCRDPMKFANRSGLPDEEADHIYKFLQTEDKYVSRGRFFPKKDLKNRGSFKNVEAWEPVITTIDRLLRNGDLELHHLVDWARRNIYASPKRDRKAVDFDQLPKSIEDVYVTCSEQPKRSKATNLLCGNTLLILTMLLAKRLESA
jgi:integrase